jgi:VanZ family protein
MRFVSAPRRRALLRTLAPLALMGAIFYFSAQQADPDQAWWTVVVRKLGHAGGYATLTALWFWALAGIVRRPLLVAAAISFVYACSDEYHQTFVEGRGGTPMDVGIDSAGIAIAVVVAVALRRRRRSTRAAPSRPGAPVSSPS